jgi:hypothetical protein
MTTNPVGKWFSHAASSAGQYGAWHAIRRKNPKALEKWVYILVVPLAAAWTLVMWGVYALLGLSDEALSAGSRYFTIDARILEWLASFVGGTQQLGGVLVLVVWGLGVVLLGAASWLGRRVIRVFSNPSTSGETHAT